MADRTALAALLAHSGHIGQRTYHTNPLLDFKALLGRDGARALGKALEGLFRTVVSKTHDAPVLRDLVASLKHACGILVSETSLKNAVKDDPSVYVLFPSTQFPDMNKMYAKLFVDLTKQIGESGGVESPTLKSLATKVFRDAEFIGFPVSADTSHEKIHTDVFLEVARNLSSDDVAVLCASSKYFMRVCRENKTWLAKHALKNEILLRPSDIDARNDSYVVGLFKRAFSVRKQLRRLAAFRDFRGFFSLLHCELGSGIVSIEYRGGRIAVDKHKYLARMEYPNNKLVGRIAFEDSVIAKTLRPPKDTLMLHLMVTNLCERRVGPWESGDEDLYDRMERGIDEYGQDVPDGYYEELYADGIVIPYRGDWDSKKWTRRYTKPLKITSIIDDAFDTVRKYVQEMKNYDDMTCKLQRRIEDITVTSGNMSVRAGD